MQPGFSQLEADRTGRTTPDREKRSITLQEYLMAGLAALCLLLVFPLSSSQSTAQSKQEIHAQQAPGAPLAPPRIRDLLSKQDASRPKAVHTYAHAEKGDTKVGLFIAAALGTFALMAAVYCIYNKFYTKQQYLHTQLNEDPDFTSDPLGTPPVFFHTSRGSGAADAQRIGYGSLSATPSIISVPPSLSPLPSAMPFPPLFVSSQSLRTISAKDLEKSCI